MEFEDILLDVGDYGKYQKYMIMIFLVPAGTLLPFFAMNVLFMVSVPDHWCNVPELSSSNLTLFQQRLLVSPPKEYCQMYNISYADIVDNDNYTGLNDSALIPCDRGWQYDKTNYEFNAATQFDLVCNDEHYNSFVLSMYNVGSIIGTPIYGALSDRIGRKITFFIVIIVTAVTGIGSVLVKDFTTFVVVKTINGSLMPSVFQLPYIIVLEIVAPEMRTRMNGIVNLGWTVGACILPLIAYYSRNWIVLGLSTSALSLVFLLYYTYLPESPRWMVSQERYEEATEIMYQIGKKNEKDIEKKELILKLQKLGEKMKKEKTVDGVENSSFDILRYPQLRKRFIILTICWMSNIMSYYGLQLNVTNLAGNEFLNFFLLCLAEVPGYLLCWMIMERFGRRWCSSIGFLLTGVICMLSSIDFPYGDVVFSMVGKMFAAGTFMATYQQSSEIYPTVVRSTGMGMSSTVAMLITLIVPYVVYLNAYGRAIPFIVFGCCAIIAGISATFLPETLNENLPQSIFDAEEFGRKQRFFSINRRKRSVSRERAASIGTKRISMEPDDHEISDSKSNGSSLQNIQFTPGAENCVSAESVRILNGGAQSMRKSYSKDSSMREVHAIDDGPDASSGVSSVEDKHRTNLKLSENQGTRLPADGKADISNQIDFSVSHKEVSAKGESVRSEENNADHNLSHINVVSDNNNDVINREDVL